MRQTARQGPLYVSSCRRLADGEERKNRPVFVVCARAQEAKPGLAGPLPLFASLFFLARNTCCALAPLWERSTELWAATNASASAYATWRALGLILRGCSWVHGGPELASAVRFFSVLRLPMRLHSNLAAAGELERDAGISPSSPISIWGNSRRIFVHRRMLR